MKSRGRWRTMGAAAALAVLIAIACGAATARAAAPAEATAKAQTTAEVLAASTSSDWRVLDPQQTLYLELPAGRVIIELAPAFAPHTSENVVALAREHYFDGLAIMRAQD